MFEFYKKRDFSALISDSFIFFKIYGKNYFKNYFMINGLLLILMVILAVVGYRELFSQIFGSNMEGQNRYFEEYFEQNVGTLILTTSLIFILFLATAIINYCFPVLYIKRASETGNTNIKTDEILSDLKANMGKILVLFLGLLFIISPLILIVFGISILLVFLLIGLVLILLLAPITINVINFLIYDYLHTERGFFGSLYYAISSQFNYPNKEGKSPFWKYWASTVVTYLIINTVVSIIAIIPMFFSIARALSVKDGDLGDGSIMAFMMIITYALIMLVSFIANNLIYVNIGLLYYDNRTDLHRKMDLSEIETIGRNEI